MLTTKLLPETGGNTEYIEQAWAHAVQHGAWRTMRGHDVLMLGAADYVFIDGALYSINGDPGTRAIPFGIRWTVNRYSNGTLDALAVEQFKLRGQEAK